MVESDNPDSKSMINKVNVQASLFSVLAALIQCIVGAYILAEPPPVHWADLLTVKFVMAVGIFATSNGFLAHINFRSPSTRTRKSDANDIIL